MKRLHAAIAISSLLILTGCVHHSPFGPEEYYLEAMGDESEIVLTIDAVRAKDALPIAENPITDRTERLTVGLMPRTTEVYPLPVEEYSMSGAAEGNFGSVEVGMAMGFVDGFEKVKEDGVKYWDNGSIKAGVPEAGILLFTDSDYGKHLERTVTNRVLRVSHETAGRMASSLAAFYIKKPETMLSLGFEIPISVLLEMDHAVLCLDLVDGEYYMSADVEMMSEKSAKSFTTIMRNQVVAELKRNGEKRPDFKKLQQMVYQDGVFSIIKDKPLTSEMVESIFQEFSAMSGGMI